MYLTVKGNITEVKTKKKPFKICVDLPVVNKFLFIFPLRPGVILCGYIDAIVTVVISIFAIAAFMERSRHAGDTGVLVQLIITFILTMIVSMLEIFCSGLLVYGAHTKNINFMRVCLDYLKVKVPAYAGLLLFSLLMKIFVVSDYWYWRNLDPWRYILFMDNMAVGMLDLVFQIYLLILVRSLIIQLSNHPDHQMLKSAYSLGVPVFHDPDITFQEIDPKYSYVKTFEGYLTSQYITSVSVPVHV